MKHTIPLPDATIGDDNMPDTPVKRKPLGAAIPESRRAY